MNKPDRQVKVFAGNGNPIHSQKIERNEPCPCGSGKKAKRCCGTETKFFKSE
ncbi:MAG TPA: SEC-C metal-binding domain-containing protein [Paludibacter sp.]